MLLGISKNAIILIRQYLIVNLPLKGNNLKFNNH